MSNWSGGLVEWTDEKIASISVVFSWQRQKAFQRAAWYKQLGYEVRIGGPGYDTDPDFFGAFENHGPLIQDVVKLHNPNATFTTRGCVRSCPFCIVPKIEPQYHELDDWPVRPIICDNNFLASSVDHFNSVIDKLKPLESIDFNQGLDARLLTEAHAERLRELNIHKVRLAWDHTAIEKQWFRSLGFLFQSGFTRRHIQTYVLIGFDDTPEDALYRLETVRAQGIRPNPMRYQPLDAEKRNQYVAPNWTERELRHFMRYWSRLRWLEHIPFEEYKHGGFSYGD